MSDELLLKELADILHEHYYPTMHEQMADQGLFDCAKEIIAKVKQHYKRKIEDAYKQGFLDRGEL